jgi:hypothetical protein
MRVDDGPKRYGDQLDLKMYRKFNLNAAKFKQTRYGLDEIIHIKRLSVPIRRHGSFDAELTFVSPLTLRELVTRIGDFYSSKIAPEHMPTPVEFKADSFYSGDYKPKTYRQLITRDGSGLCFWEGILVNENGEGELCLGS